MQVHIEGDFAVLMGALVIWLGGLRSGVQAVERAIEGRWLLALFYGSATGGAIMIGARVWGAA